MTPDILRRYGTIDTISTLPVNEFPILVCKTRKTAVWTQNINSFKNQGGKGGV